MFNPSDFLTLAEELAQSGEDESKIRTSIGRTYYAAFLNAREQLKIGGWNIPKTAKAHWKVREILQKYGGAGRVLADKLLKLSRIRDNADYELGQTFEQKTAFRKIKLAQKIIEKVKEKKFEKLSES